MDSLDPVVGNVAPQIGDIMTGNWYINLHNAFNPFGEIRGQLLPGTFQPVPLPAALWLMLPALGARFGIR